MRVFAYYNNWDGEWVIQALDGIRSGEILERSSHALLADAEACGGGFTGDLSSLGEEAREAAPLDQEAYALTSRGGRYVYLGSANHDFVSAPALYLSSDGQALALEGPAA